MWHALIPAWNNKEMKKNWKWLTLSTTDQGDRGDEDDQGNEDYLGDQGYQGDEVDQGDQLDLWANSGTGSSSVTDLQRLLKDAVRSS